MPNSEEDRDQINQITDAMSTTSLITFIIPFAFMIFMSCSMNRAWSFYLSLQIITNIENMKMLTIPASAQTFIKVMSEMANFKLMQNYHVKRMMQIYVFGDLKELQQFLMGQGMLFIGVLMGFVLLIAIVICKLANKGKELI